MGSVSLASPPYRWLMIAIVAVITAAVAVYMAIGTYTAREQVTGQLVPTRGVLNVVPLASGTVVSVKVAEGQSVEKGDVLLVLDAETASMRGETRALVDQQLTLQQDKIASDITGLQQINAEEAHGLRTRVGSLEQQLQLVVTQKHHRSRQVDLAKQQLDKMQSMVSAGYVSISQVEQQEAAVIDAVAALQDVTRQEVDVRAQLDQMRQSLREQPLRARADRHDLERKLNDIEQARAENESRRTTVIRAQDSGVVSSLIAKEGQTVGPGQVLASIIPTGSRLEANLLIPSRAIGFVHTGQRVVIRYQAFPYQKFGQRYGALRSISSTALTPQELSVLTGRSDLQEQHYRAFVELNEQDVEAYGQKVPLRAGMALDADLLTDKRSLFEWVLEPLYALGRRTAS